MTKEQTEKAAGEYADSIPQFDVNKTYCVNDFKAGARWRIRSVWHTTADIPVKGNRCLVEYIDPEGETKIRVDWHNGCEWVEMCHYDKILRWVYIEDLLPNKED